MKGRGGGHGRGLERRPVPSGRTIDPSEGWRVKNVPMEAIKMENSFVSDVLLERARLFCCSALARIDTEVNFQAFKSFQSKLHSSVFVTS